MHKTYETSNTRLQKVFLQLCESRLVKERCVTGETVDEFSKLIAVAYPDIAQAGDIVRGMLHHNRPAFYKYLHITDQRYLVLACDGGAIAGMLGVRDIVTIKWNRENKCFNVESTDSSYNYLHTVNNPNVSQRALKTSKYDKNKKPKNKRVIAPPTSPAAGVTNVSYPHFPLPEQSPTCTLPVFDKSLPVLDFDKSLPNLNASWADY